jgi:hypothetical protein
MKNGRKKGVKESCLEIPGLEGTTMGSLQQDFN